MGEEKKDRSWMLIVALGVVLAVVISGWIWDRTELNDQLTRTISLKDTCVAGWDESLEIIESSQDNFDSLYDSFLQLEDTVTDNEFVVSFLMKKGRFDDLVKEYQSELIGYLDCVNYSYEPIADYTKDECRVLDYDGWRANIDEAREEMEVAREAHRLYIVGKNTEDDG